MHNVNPVRILIIDDNENIHQDFRKILSSNHDTTISLDMEEDEAILFNKALRIENTPPTTHYKIDSAYQGKEGLALVKQSLKDKSPYALAFVDMLMPPGWNGIETIKALWDVDPNIQMVICSAYSDYSWEDITKELQHSENLLILKKPFEYIEIYQLAASLTKKWDLKKLVQFQIENLEKSVQDRTKDLEESLSLINTTLESMGDGILVLSKNQKITKYNTRFLGLWNISEKSIKTNSAENIFKEMSTQVNDSKQFLKNVSTTGTISKIIEKKEIDLKNGTFLELFRHPQYLNEEIIGTVFSFKDVTQRKLLENQLMHQATHDNLTGLTNRILLSDRVEQAIQLASRYRMVVGFFLFDLDNFKNVNDSYGHPIGDELLKSVSKRLKDTVRGVDTVTRLGGDEFVILIAPQKDIESLHPLIDKILKIFEKPYKIGKHNISITASLGISVYPNDGKDYPTLLKKADIALYQSKDLGRNTYQFYMPEFAENNSKNIDLLSDLRYAIERNEIILHYQPLVELKTNKIIGLEALCRWQHPTKGLIPPTILIPLAEKSGLIVSIGEWILREACRQTKIWQKAGTPNLQIAVNISTYQLQHKNFIDTVVNILAETQLDPQFLELEITEGIIIANCPEFIEKMTELKRLGIRLSIDDFGTGYSNLAYLKYFPFDKVKIDKTFIDEITSEFNDNCIVETIINLSKKMGLTVLAEGVEKATQVDYLTEHHGDQVQGYYFSEPLDIKKCEEILKTGLIFKEEIEPNLTLPGQVDNGLYDSDTPS